MREVHIYGLVDPREPDVIHYVGRTSNLKARLSVHLCRAKAASPFPVHAWIRDLLVAGVTLEIRSLEVVPEGEWGKREEEARLRLLAAGHPLTNVLKGGVGARGGGPARALAGKTFGLLTVLEPDPTRPRGSGHEVYWLCRCACGRTVSVRSTRLRDGRRACGLCIHPRFKHGGKHAPEYRIWENMRARCNNPHNPAYARYGGRGIGIDPRWDDFAVFLADVGPRPDPQYSLDRINNDGSYEPGNVRWASAMEQANNRRPRAQRSQ